MITWAKIINLCSVAEARLSFIEMYRNAYNSTNSIKTHIDTGEAAVKSGRNAFQEARRNYQSRKLTNTHTYTNVGKADLWGPNRYLGRIFSSSGTNPRVFS